MNGLALALVAATLSVDSGWNGQQPLLTPPGEAPPTMLPLRTENPPPTPPLRSESPPPTSPIRTEAQPPNRSLWAPYTPPDEALVESPSFDAPPPLGGGGRATPRNEPHPLRNQRGAPIDSRQAGYQEKNARPGGGSLYGPRLTDATGGGSPTTNGRVGAGGSPDGGLWTIPVDDRRSHSQNPGATPTGETDRRVGFRNGETEGIRQASLPRNTNDAVGPPAGPPLKAEQEETPVSQGDKPWVPLMLTSLALFGSVGANIYLGWIAWGLYWRQRRLTRQVQAAGGNVF